MVYIQYVYCICAVSCTCNFVPGIQGYDDQTGDFDPGLQYDFVRKFLLYFPGSSSQVKLYHCLEMQHRLVTGVQRVWCYPFANHRFWKRNICDTVFFRSPKIDSEADSTFQLPRDRDQLEYGKVLLFFKIRIPGLFGRVRELACAFVKYYDKYLVKSIYMYCMCTVCGLY